MSTNNHLTPQTRHISSKTSAFLSPARARARYSLAGSDLLCESDSDTEQEQQRHSIHDLAHSDDDELLQSDQMRESMLRIIRQQLEPFVAKAPTRFPKQKHTRAPKSIPQQLTTNDNNIQHDIPQQDLLNNNTLSSRSALIFRVFVLIVLLSAATSILCIRIPPSQISLPSYDATYISTTLSSISASLSAISSSLSNSLSQLSQSFANTSTSLFSSGNLLFSRLLSHVSLLVSALSASLHHILSSLISHLLAFRNAIVQSVGRCIQFVAKLGSGPSLLAQLWHTNSVTPSTPLHAIVRSHVTNAIRSISSLDAVVLQQLESTLDQLHLQQIESDTLSILDTIYSSDSLHYIDAQVEPDYALGSAGGYILSSTPSRAKQLLVHSLLAASSLLGGSSSLRHALPNAPSIVLSPSVSPGECWAFTGSVGEFTVQLARPIYVTAVSIEHTPISEAFSSASAPKSVAVDGIVWRKDHGSAGTQEYVALGVFEYKVDRQVPRIQRFEIEFVQKLMSAVRFKVLSNHGNPSYTCVYRIRVHGLQSDEILLQ